jgi:antirestriction protein ArdC
MSKVHDIITEKIIKELEKGSIPWKRPWKTSGLLPTNLVSKKAYRGINTLLLSLSGFESPYWLTFKQSKALGGSVRKGEKGSMVVFYTDYSKENSAGEVETFPVLRYYNVFNVSQCDGIEAKVPVEEEEALEFTPIERCEAIVESMPLRPAINHGKDKAYYSPREDSVGLPSKERFTSIKEYYSTLFHELAHSTGHKGRLDRDLDKMAAFGSADYSKEELIAEMGAAFLCGEAEIHQATIENSAAYIKGWLSKLKKDKTFLVNACAQGQRAADHILGN